MKYSPPTPEELDKARALVLKYKPFIEIFSDDLKHLLFQAAYGLDSEFERQLLALIGKLDVFMSMDETQFLNKEIGDQPKDVTSHRAKRTFGKVVPSKAEEKRRQSGGGHPIFGFDDFGVTGGEGIDDDIPF